MTDAAYLFDVYPHPHRSELMVWILQGGKATMRRVPYQPHFCVQAEAQSLDVAERLLAEDSRVARTWRDRQVLWLRGPETEVLRVQPHRLQDLHAVATNLRRRTHCKGFLFFDVDHQPESRWMHAQGLWTLCELDRVEGDPVLRAAPHEDRFSILYEDPPLRSVHLQVVVDASPESVTPSLQAPLLGIALEDQWFGVDVVGSSEEERRVFLAFHAALKMLDPDVLETWKGDAFDLPYLLQRIRIHGLHHHVWLGRAPDPHQPAQQAKSLHIYGRWIYKTPGYYLQGRWHLDLSKKALDQEEHRKDLHGIVYLARVSNRRAQDCNRNGAGYALQQMQIDRATDMGVALPWKRNLAEDWKDAATLCAVDRGGQIMVPRPGILDDVVACDFSGYYPTIIAQHNLSSDTINCTCCPDGPRIPDLEYHVCTRQDGHQSQILRQLWGHRRWAKAVLRRQARGETLPVASLAKARAIKSEHKALGVVCFGYFRYRNARFGCAEVHQAIQAIGRDGMTRARAMAQREGFDLVHAMTDCLFLHKPGVTRSEASRLAGKVGKSLHARMDVEGVYRWVVFLPSKVHSRTHMQAVGVPNRYYGKFEDGSLKVRGIDVQRHSTLPWVHDVQTRMLAVLQQADCARAFMERIPAALAVAKEASLDLLEGRVPPEALASKVQATKSIAAYHAHTNTRTALLHLHEGGRDVEPGEYVRYVVTRRRGPRPSRAQPLETTTKRTWLGTLQWSADHRHALRLLARSVETILSPFGYQEALVESWLLGRRKHPLETQQACWKEPVLLPYRA